MANTTGGKSYNWGIIIPVGLTLIAAIWGSAVTFTELRTDLTAIKSNVEKIATNVEKLQAAGSATSKEEAATPPDSPDFQRESQDIGSEFCDRSVRLGELDNLIGVGETVEGTLSEADEQFDDKTYVDAWVLLVCEPGTITIEMESEVLDSYIVLSSLSSLDNIGEDDDGGDGLDARLMVNVAPGVYLVAANTSAFGSLREGTGDYTLSVHR